MKIYPSKEEMAIALNLAKMGRGSRALEKQTFQVVYFLVLDSGFDGDVAVNFNAATELLVGFDSVDFFEEGVRVHVFHRFNFDQTLAAGAQSVTVEIPIHPFINFHVLENSGLTEVGS